MSKDHHQKLLQDNTTKTYHKAPHKLEASINLEAKSICNKLEVCNSVKCITRTPAIVTLKDTKATTLQSNLPFNKSIKKELGKVSKQIAGKMDSAMIEILQFNQ